MAYKKQDELTLKELHVRIHEIRDELLKTERHARRLIDEYDDLQDRLLKIIQAVEQAEKEHGFTQEEIYETEPKEELIITENVDDDVLDKLIGNYNNERGVDPG